MMEVLIRDRERSQKKSKQPTTSAWIFSNQTAHINSINSYQYQYINFSQSPGELQNYTTRMHASSRTVTLQNCTTRKTLFFFSEYSID